MHVRSLTLLLFLLIPSVAFAQPRGTTHIPSRGIPAGSDGQVQYNDDGVFGADAGFITDKAGTVTTSVALDTPRVEYSAGQLTFNDTVTGIKTLAELSAGAAGGNAWSDAVDSDILPTGNDNTFDLGSAGASFANIWADGVIMGALQGNVLGNVTGDLTGTASLLDCTGCVDDTDAANDLEIDNTTNVESDGTVSGNVALDSPILVNSAGVTITLQSNLDTNENDLIHEFPRSIVVENLAAADDDMPFGHFVNNVLITKFGCSYTGTGTTPAEISLEDGDGNAMTHATVTCVASTEDIDFVPVTAANALVVGELLVFDVDNAVSPETDTYAITVGYTE